jgi:transcriptional regulator with XRE-family HTH domain
MKAHWTERSNKDFLFRVVADFIGQIEKKMEKEDTSQGKLAQKLKISKGRVSQLLNSPGNFSLLTVIKLARTLGMKISIVAYEDEDPKNVKGPVNSEIFTACWAKCNSPRDFWGVEKANTIEIKFLTLTLYKTEQPNMPFPLVDASTSGIPQLTYNPTFDLTRLGEENLIVGNQNYYVYPQRSR